MSHQTQSLNFPFEDQPVVPQQITKPDAPEPVVPQQITKPDAPEPVVPQQIGNKKIFRFKLDDAVNEALAVFTSKHRFNKRKEFKNDWENWCGDNKDLIKNETRRLENLGYVGDCVSKMWTSVRYYHIKKAHAKDSADGCASADEEKKKRTYIMYDKEFLSKMKNHIEKHVNNETFKPAIAFEQFKHIHDNDIQIVLADWISKGLLKDDFDIKLKKTYKNKYFNIVK